jgi:hypothetical protein
MRHELSYDRARSQLLSERRMNELRSFPMPPEPLGPAFFFGIWIWYKEFQNDLGPRVDEMLRQGPAVWASVEPED